MPHDLISLKKIHPFLYTFIHFNLLVYKPLIKNLFFFFYLHMTLWIILFNLTKENSNYLTLFDLYYNSLSLYRNHLEFTYFHLR